MHAAEPSQLVILVRRQMQSKGLSAKYMQGVGFKNFAAFLETKIENMFVESIGPVLPWQSSAECHASDKTGQDRVCSKASCQA